MNSYDSWLLKQTGAYWEPCEPELNRDEEYAKCINCDNNYDCNLWQEI